MVLICQKYWIGNGKILTNKMIKSTPKNRIFYIDQETEKINKKNGKKVIVQPEDQLSLAYELTNKYKLEKNKSDDINSIIRNISGHLTCTNF